MEIAEIAFARAKFNSPQQLQGTTVLHGGEKVASIHHTPQKVELVLCAAAPYINSVESCYVPPSLDAKFVC